MSEELKPCPFCGGNVMWCSDDPEDPHDCDQITCDNCGMQFDSYNEKVKNTDSFDDAKKEVAKLWNQRITIQGK